MIDFVFSPEETNRLADAREKHMYAEKRLETFAKFIKYFNDLDWEQKDKDVILKALNPIFQEIETSEVNSFWEVKFIEKEHREKGYIKSGLLGICVPVQETNCP